MPAGKPSPIAAAGGWEFVRGIMRSAYVGKPTHAGFFRWLMGRATPHPLTRTDIWLIRFIESQFYGN